jgi:hypothetical protein
MIYGQLQWIGAALLGVVDWVAANFVGAILGVLAYIVTNFVAKPTSDRFSDFRKHRMDALRGWEGWTRTSSSLSDLATMSQKSLLSSPH